MTDRKTIEREYHNKRYTSSIREKVSRNYVISTSIKHDYYLLLVSICHDKSVLEIGCAGGERICRLAEQNNKMTGIDISESAIEQAKKTALSDRLDDIQLLVMDAENLEFEDNSFDIVYGGSILHHLQLDRIFHELNRVMRPGGKAVFIEPLGHNWFINLYRKRTPNYRTETEHPLLMSDIEYAKQYFTEVQTRHYYLMTIMAIPFARMFFFKPLVKCLETIDRTIFTLFPFLKRYSWMVLLILDDPLKQRG